MIDNIILSITIVCISIPIYVYVGYPALLFIITRFYQKTHQQNETQDRSVSLIISCFNEHDVIEQKIKNSLEINYPKHLLEIILVSDGSTDGTDDIVLGYKDQGIKLIRQEGRLGKTSGLNLAVPQAKGEIIVFSDANAMYQTDAINKLVRNFVSPKVGYVVGAALYCDGDTNAAAKSEHSYWQYELAIKKMESQLHSVVGGDGAIYAIRNDLYDPLDPRDINDFVNPLQIIAKGYRGLFEPEAICLETTAANFKKEAKRKERIVNRSFRGLLRVKSVLNPFQVGLFSFQVISHKLLRWLVPIFLVGIAVGSTLLSYWGNGLFQLLYVAQMLFLWFAIVGYYQQATAQIYPLFFYPYYFLMVNYFSLIGVIKALADDIQVTWSTPREIKNVSEIGTGEKIIALLLVIIPALLMLGFPS